MRPSVVVVALLSACGGRGCAPVSPSDCIGEDACGTGEAPPTDTAPWEDCFTVIVPILPLADAVDVDPATPFVLGFNQSDEPVAPPRLVDADGVDVPLGPRTWSTTFRQVSFAPRAPLAPSTAYRLLVDRGCDDTFELPFTTAAAPTIAPDALVGASLQLDLRGLVAVEPLGVTQLVGSLLGEAPLLGLLVTGATADTLDVHLVPLGADGGQLECRPTWPLASTPFDRDPAFGPAARDAMTFPFAGGVLTVRGPAFAGVLRDGGTGLTGGRLAGELDLATLVTAVAEPGQAIEDPTGCDLVDAFSAGAVTCEPCADDLSARCVPFDVVNLSGTASSTPYVARTADDVAADPACAAP